MKKNKFAFDSPGSVLIAALTHLLISIIFALVLSAISSLLLLKAEDPLGYTSIISFGIILISVFLCSFMMSVITEMPAICSLISALGISALLISLSAFTENTSNTPVQFFIILYVITPILAYIASFLALRSKQNKRATLKRRKAYK